MEVSALTLRVLLLFFPGVLCAMLVETLTVNRERTAAQFLTHSFVLGLASYLLLYAGRWACAGAAGALGLPPPLPVTFIDALLDETLRIAWGEIVLAAGMAAVLGAAVSAGVNHHVLHGGARYLRISRKRGSLDVWGYVLGLPGTNWIIVRDLPNGLSYLGWLEEFSETADMAELWLRDVAVHESNGGTKLYDADAIYLGRDARTLVIEVLPERQPGGAPDERKDAGTGKKEHARQDGPQSQPKDTAA